METFAEKIGRLTYRTACELVRRADAITVTAGRMTEQAARMYERGEGWDARFAALNLEN
jgi:hypothetical protein